MNHLPSLRCAFFFVGLGLLGCSKLETERGPLVVIGERFHDFGAVARGGVAAHSFSILNNTSDRMVIDLVRQSCSCAFVEVTDKVLSPGQSTSVKVTLEMDGRLGKEAAVALGSKAIDSQPLLTLRLRAHIREDLRVTVDPETIRVSSKEPTASALVRLYCPSDFDSGLTVRAECSWLHAEIEPTRERPILEDLSVQEFGLQVKVLGDLSPGNYHSFVVLTPRSDQIFPLRVPVVATIESDFSCGRTAVFLGTELDRQEKRHLTYRRREGSEVRVTDVECTDDRAEIRWSEELDHLVLDLDIAQVDGGETWLRGEIRIAVNRKDGGCIVTPIIGRFRE